MPTAQWKNIAYTLALPFLGMPSRGRLLPAPEDERGRALERALIRHRAVGAAVQEVRGGTLGRCYAFGYGRLGEGPTPVTRDTFFRCASISKLVTALGVMVLAEENRLSLDEDVSLYLGTRIRNPRYPEAPITLAHLLSHTSGIVDGPGYGRALGERISYGEALSFPGSFGQGAPGAAFCYSNLGAGLCGSVAEAVTGQSLDSFMRERVFAPLEMEATYSLCAIAHVERVAAGYQVMPWRGPEKSRVFDPEKRRRTARPIEGPDPDFHYLLGAGSLFATAPSLGKIACLLAREGEPLLRRETFRQMVAAFTPYAINGRYMAHGLGIARVTDDSLWSGPLLNHQGFAYGMAQGLFLDPETGNGFVQLNSGASVARRNHIAKINRAMVPIFMEA